MRVVGARGGSPGVFEFIGRNDRPIDDKGRLAVPKEFLDELEGPDREALFITPGKGCIWLVPPTYYRGEFSRGVSRGLQAAGGVPDQFFHLCQRRTLDKAGRILIDQAARELAGIPAPDGPDKVIVVVCGSGKYIQIWEKGAYERAAVAPAQVAQFLPASGNFDGGAA